MNQSDVFLAFDGQSVAAGLSSESCARFGEYDRDGEAASGRGRGKLPSDAPVVLREPPVDHGTATSGS